jgi:hypothetical protein
MQETVLAVVVCAGGHPTMIRLPKALMPVNQSGRLLAPRLPARTSTFSMTPSP